MKTMTSQKFINKALSAFLIIGGMMLITLVLVKGEQANAQDHGETEDDEPSIVDLYLDQEGSPLHPSFKLLDQNGDNVLESGAPLSTMQTCGACHDTEFIATHSFHSDVGLSTFNVNNEIETVREWDTSLGSFGRWNPFSYRYLSPENDEIIDMTTPEWVQLFGARHVGGGPALYSRDGQLLTDLDNHAESPETNIFDDETGDWVAWDWQDSGTIEMNCFLCHYTVPNNDARIDALHKGAFGWANSATLAGSGIIEADEDSWTWNADAFSEDGTLSPEYVRIEDPTDRQCGQCHGLVHVDAQTPAVIDECSPDQWTTITTGQILSPQRIANSGLNIQNKSELARAFDVHAERVVGCTNCHYSLNNPVYYQEPPETRPDHLVFDPRRLDFGEYLQRPLHQFAKGQSPQNPLAPEYDNSLRRCDDCHSIENSHEWLPYKERHTDALACESCHIPQLYAPARQVMDWTVLRENTTARTECRGIEFSEGTYGTTFITGYQPILLSRENKDGTRSLAPHNLITYWYWIYDASDAVRPVPFRYLEAAWINPTTNAYADDILAMFDADNDGALTDEELRIDSDAKETLIKEKLENQGLENPRIVGEVEPYSINHNVTHGDWAIRECTDCHTENSRLAEPIILANVSPNGKTPSLWENPSIEFPGEITVGDNGALYFQPLMHKADLYILGHDSSRTVNLIGILALVSTLGMVVVHGGLRVIIAKKAHQEHSNNEADHTVHEVYMYSIYERQWHWLQSILMFGLLFTGLIIHKPDIFHIFSFKYVVQLHNIFGGILVVNAALALFYHLASGDIQQYLPRPYGFFSRAILQTKYYVYGLFKGEPHPFEKTPDRKLNPIQQFTYFMILNVLLPIQVITGVLMWIAQAYPDITQQAGGLTFLAPLHALAAWLFASFIIMHVYMTTTGHTPLANIRAMMLGWDEVPTVDPKPDKTNLKTKEETS